MARRKKRKKPSGEKKTLKKKEEAFNPPKGKLATLKEITTDTESKTLQEQAEHYPVQDEDDLFLEVLSDVTPLTGSRKKVTRFPDPDIKPAHPAGNDELEAMAHLSDLVSGNAEIDITFTDEYIEGSVIGLNRKLMQQLKKGLFPIQDYEDLHGLTQKEAEAKVRDFLIQSYRLGLRCVLIVHGRGLNSEDNIPILKKHLPIWLNRGPVNKIVLAFSTAKPYDGGLGAIYVLLRKSKSRI